jgi:hypothetical protein
MKLVSDYLIRADIVLSLAAELGASKLLSRVSLRMQEDNHDRLVDVSSRQIRRVETAHFGSGQAQSSKLCARQKKNDSRGPVNSGERLMYLRIFLKVCEGCGVLWFRAQDCPEVYCPGCARKLRCHPQVKRTRRPGPRGRHRMGVLAGGGAA